MSLRPTENSQAHGVVLPALCDHARDPLRFLREDRPCQRSEHRPGAGDRGGEEGMGQGRRKGRREPRIGGLGEERAREEGGEGRDRGQRERC